jgi:hypothetical protein
MCPRYTTRGIFVAALALFAVQSLFIHRFGEPYPAIVMPGFEGSGAYRVGGGLEIETYEAAFVAANGGATTVTPRVLLQEFPDSHHATIGYCALKPTSTQGEPAKAASWLGRVRAAVFPGFQKTPASSECDDKLASLREWLTRRAATLAPGLSISRVEIRWSRQEVRVTGGTPKVIQRELIGTLFVELERKLDGR